MTKLVYVPFVLAAGCTIVERPSDDPGRMPDVPAGSLPCDAQLELIATPTGARVEQFPLGAPSNLCLMLDIESLHTPELTVQMSDQFSASGLGASLATIEGTWLDGVLQVGEDIDNFEALLFELPASEGLILHVTPHDKTGGNFTFTLAEEGSTF